MSGARRFIGPIAAVWLVCQAATLAVVPALLEVSLAACVCTHGGDAACPMHHKTAAGPNVCVMQSATPDVPASLALLFDVAGLVPVSPLAIVPARIVSAMPSERSALRHRSAPPDSPPPRA